MNKIKKIGVLGLALCGLLVSLYTSADPTPAKVNTLSLELKKISDSCTMEDYSFGNFTVSISDQAIAAVDHPVSCSMRGNPTQTISIAIKNGLTTTGGDSIDKSKFTFSLTNPTVTGSLLNGSTVNNTFAEQRTLYNKALKKIGTWTGTLTISGTIPGSTPSGVYTGELDLILQ